MFFYRQSSAVAASRTIGDVTYTANVAGSAGNNIAVTHTPASAGSAGTKASRTFNHASMSGSASLVVTAKNVGTSGNSIAINFQSSAMSGSDSASVFGNTITVTTSTAGSITLGSLRTVLLNNASSLVDVSNVTGNSNLRYTTFNGNLSGGTNSTPAESTAVIVGANDPNATAITVRIQSGATVETVAGIVNAASSSISASGTGSVSDTNITLLLQGGAD